MLLLDVDSAAVEKTVAGMVTEIQTLPPKMHEQFLAWQIADMKRKYPNVETPDKNTVATSIWPRSRLSMEEDKRKRKRRVRLIRGRARKALKPMTGAVISNRPILRPALYDKLVERMAKLLGTIKWSAAA